jgi:hypothetical protein
MPKENEKEKNLTLLEKDLSVISAVNNPKLSPYLDIFSHYPDNISIQGLGILAGFFKISDLRDESAYIVNFISSVVKKEYYVNPKRTIESSFDSALRKVNLALSEIAKEGNVNWIGKIDGVVCILEKNNLHFSVCGKGKVLLLRNELLTEISKDMALDDLEPNPLKTFVNVSSGRLEKEDKIIICQDDIFKVFSENEIKKGALRFPREKFVQFLKTALTNKLEIVGTIVADIFEKDIVASVIPEPQPETYNAFSKKSFEKKRPAPLALKDLLEEEEKREYTDGKTGHIYIQEEAEGVKKEKTFNIYWFLFKEKAADVYYWIKNKTKRESSFLKRSTARAWDELISKMKNWRDENKQKRLQKIKFEAENKNKQALPAKKKIPFWRTPGDDVEAAEIMAKPVETQEKIPSEKLLFIKKFVPNLEKIKLLFSSLSKKQKIYSLSIIAFIIIVPFVFIRIQDAVKTKNIPPPAEEKIPSTKELLSSEKNIIFLDTAGKVFDIQNPKSIMILNGKIIAMGDSQTITQDSSGNIKEISWDQNYGAIKETAPMKDLNLALAYTDQNKVISFLSATSQFTDNVIAIPENAKITGLGTYLTYAYFLDSQNNQIYRYPRATGGFGDKTNWLKDNLSLSNSCCMAVDENVYFINDSKVIKLFKGQNQNLNLEQTVNSFAPDKIYTNSDTQNIYVLDKSHGRIISYAKDGSLLKQYFYEDIKNSIDFSVDEKNNKVYFLTSKELDSFNLE